MANLRLFCCLVVAFLGTGWGLYGQCSCSGTYYYYDGDEDGYAANWQSADRSLAYTDHIDSGCGQGHSGNVIYTCGSPPRYYTSNSREDCDDNDRSVQRDETWYYDADGDGVGGSQRQTSCGSPGSGWVTSSGDCNDNDASVRSERTFYQDNDGDGVGGSAVTACSQGNYVTTGGDCNDNDASVQSERTFYQDNDGDGVGGSAVTACSQGSYVTSGGDCNDNDSSIKSAQTWYYDQDGDGRGTGSGTSACTAPGSNYVNQGGDECDTVAGVYLVTTWYADCDKDGYGSDTARTACSKPTEGNCDWVTNSDDLDDDDINITDGSGQNYYRDADNDGYGNPHDSIWASVPPSGYVANDDDCNDDNASENPNAVWYRDNDGDGFGLSGSRRSQCTRPSGYSSSHGDLDDTNILITNVPPRNFYRDADGDTYGNPNVSRYQSHAPAGFVVNAADCDDTDPLLHDRTLWALDQDNDGLGYNATLLNQTNTDRATPGAHAPPAGVTPIVYGCINPSTAQYTYVNNSTDYDDQEVLISDKKPLIYYPDADKDGFGTDTNTLFQSDPPQSATMSYSAVAGDCDDNNDRLHPNTIWYADADGDGWGHASDTLLQCLAPTGRVSNNLDFDDSTTHITNIQPFWSYRDADSDGYGDALQKLFYSYLPSGYVRNDEDCNDNRGWQHPDTIWYADSDSDGWGGTVTQTACGQPTGFVSNTLDHDDTTNKISHNAPVTYYLDADDDRYGDPAVSLYYSPEFKPDDYVTNNLDCDDTNALINPQKLWYADSDGDGLGDPNRSVAQCETPTGYVDNDGDLGDGSIYITNIATVTFYPDRDGDGFGDPNKGEGYSFAPPNYYPTGDDCNDADDRIHPNTIWYRDSDGDGFGSRTVSFTGCIPPEDYLLDRSDLDDTNPLITNIPGRYFYVDQDGDGFGIDAGRRFQSYNPDPEHYATQSGDCDDSRADIHPAMLWYTDNDRDGYGTVVAYQGCNPVGYVSRFPGDYDDTTSWITNHPPLDYYQDADGDGDGNPAVHRSASYRPPGYVNNDRDCNDQDPYLHHRSYWFADKDLDSYGDPAVYLQQCSAPAGYVANGWDYDDSTDQITHVAPQTYYYDGDGDGYGRPDKQRFASFPIVPYVVDGDDCNDNNPLIHPKTVWYLDADGDTFGGDVAQQQCLQPLGYVLNTDDWNDEEACITDVYPQDYYLDADGDGYGDPNTLKSCSALPEGGYVVNGDDCDDTEAAIKPTTIWYPDRDGDGYGVDEPGTNIEQCAQPEGFARLPGDCDDDNPNRLPGLAGVIAGLSLTFEQQYAMTDCAAPLREQLDELSELLSDTTELAVFADRDADGFGDEAEAFSIHAVDALDFLIALNADDACPEVFGLEMGCPEPPRAFSSKELVKDIYQWLLWLLQQMSEEEKKEASAAVSATALGAVEVFPNPTQGKVTARWETEIGALVSQVVLLGYHHQSTVEVPFDEKKMEVEMDLTAMPSDLYFLQLTLADGRGITKKIIKN